MGGLFGCYIVLGGDISGGGGDGGDGAWVGLRWMVASIMESDLIRQAWVILRVESRQSRKTCYRVYSFV